MLSLSIFVKINRKMKSKVLLIILISLIGLVAGMGSFTFFYGKGYSYLSDDPKACLNCHIMRDQYDSWSKSSHHHVTNCNSCHTPQNIYMKYINKAENGFMHSLKFTTGNYKDPIRIRQHNFDVAMKSCLKCHSGLMNSTLHAESIGRNDSCVKCHRDVGHTH